MNSDNATTAARSSTDCYPVSARTVRKELIQAGWQQGHVSTEITCENCDKSCNGRLGWWLKVSYEYDEWKCLCRSCAYADVHQYDDFDGEEFQRICESAG